MNTSQFLGKLIKSVKVLLKAYILRDEQLLEVRRFLKIDGDNTLRVNYPLNENSVVFDCGGYCGDWTAKIVEKYNCHVHIFEPSPIFAKICADRFLGNSKVQVNPFAIGATNAEHQLFLMADGTSIFNKTSQFINVQIHSFSEYVTQKKIDKIDLMKINIEGGEYDLLSHIIEIKWMERIMFFQIQFHNFVENHVVKRDDIRRHLYKTHIELFNYPFVWEGWGKAK